MRRILLFGLCFAFSGTATAVAQPARCPNSTLVAPAADIDRWVAGQKIYLAPDFRGEIFMQYCAAAAQLIAGEPKSADRMRASISEIDGVRSAVIADYLDNYVDLTRTVRTVRAVLRSHLGVSGFSRPVARTRGVVRISYRRAIERMQMRGQDFEPWPRFLLLPGPASYTGIARGQAVCRGQVTVSVATPALISC